VLSVIAQWAFGVRLLARLAHCESWRCDCAVPRWREITPSNDGLRICQEGEDDEGDLKRDPNNLILVPASCGDETRAVYILTALASPLVAAGRSGGMVDSPGV
jgi:hypothetical protein